MPEMLLAADERLEKSLIGPLQSRGWSVRVVRFLSEIPQACATEPQPEVVAATFPPALGAHHALAELKQRHGDALPPIVALVPESRRGEHEALRASGAAAVFAAPIHLGELHDRTKELADGVRRERERKAEEARKLAERLNSMPPTKQSSAVEETSESLATQPLDGRRRSKVWLVAALVLVALLAFIAMWVVSVSGATSPAPALDGTTEQPRQPKRIDERVAPR